VDKSFAIALNRYIQSSIRSFWTMACQTRCDGTRSDKRRSI